MNRAALLHQLAHAERHIREGERHLLRQREMVSMSLSATVMDTHERQAWRGTSWIHLKWRGQSISMIGRVSCWHCKRQNKLANREPLLPATRP
jgi:hypothetical protein